MKIVIVDDEPLVRIGIKSSVNWAEYGIDIVGEADDGNKALALIEELQPDAVLLDIKMPNKDGLDVLREMKAKSMQTAVVILSSFDDFNLVKEAMKLGASDYFHKPTMSGEEIKDVLLQLKETTDKSASISESRPSRQVVLEQLLAGNLEVANETKLQEGNNHVILFSVKDYKQVVKRYPNENPSILTNAIQNILTELLSKEKEVEFFIRARNQYTLLISNKESKSSQEHFQRTNSLLHVIQDSLKRFVNVDTVYGISETFHSFKEMPTAFKQAEEGLDKHFYQEETFLFYSRLKRNDQDIEEATASVVKMKQALADGKDTEFLSRLAEWEVLLKKTMSLTRADVLKIYEGLAFMIEESPEYLERKEQLDELESFEEVASFYRTVFQGKMKRHDAKVSPVIHHIIDYLQDNYQENISLASLGDRFKVSSNYISRLFKKEMGRGLFDYLQETRIEKAKNLLKTSDLKIYEIAEEVGFNSQVHFAIVFNKYVGMSPKDYRRESV